MNHMKYLWLFKSIFCKNNTTWCIYCFCYLFISSWCAANKFTYLRHFCTHRVKQHMMPTMCCTHTHKLRRRVFRVEIWHKIITKYENDKRQYGENKSTRNRIRKFKENVKFFHILCSRVVCTCTQQTLN